MHVYPRIIWIHLLTLKKHKTNSYIVIKTFVTCVLTFLICTYALTCAYIYACVDSREICE